MMEVVDEVRVMILPVSTSVMVILYSMTIPLTSPEGGGNHDRRMEVEVAGVSITFCGGLEGAGKGTKSSNST